MQGLTQWIYVGESRAKPLVPPTNAETCAAQPEPAEQVLTKFFMISGCQGKAETYLGPSHLQGETKSRKGSKLLVREPGFPIPFCPLKLFNMALQLISEEFLTA